MKLLEDGLKQLAAADKAASFINDRFDEITGALQLYINEIERFNSAYGLVKADSREILIVKHILDSLAPLGHIADLLHINSDAVSGKTLADVGSGAGLPGIPLAICLQTIHIALIERMGRRAGFLRNTIAVLASAFSGLDLLRITVEEKEWEGSPNQFDCIVLRALHPLDSNFAAKLARLLAPGGAIAAYKGRHQTAQTELDSLHGQSGLTGFTTELIPITVPFLNEERCLAVIRH